MVQTAAEIAERRSFPRRAVLWTGTLQAGDFSFDCQIWNVSLGGARLRVNLPLEAGARIVLSLPQAGRFPGVVAWTGDGELGLKFGVEPTAIREHFGDRVVTLGLDPEADDA